MKDKLTAYELWYFNDQTIAIAKISGRSDYFYNLMNHRIIYLGTDYKWHRKKNLSMSAKSRLFKNENKACKWLMKK